MKKIKSILPIFIFTLSILLINENVFAVNNINETKNQKIILIDPGHGGIDGGAKSKDGTVEKDINLAISLKLKECLEKKGYKVEMTREVDSGLYKKGKTVREKKQEDLANRVKKKEETKCDLFISIHQNMFPQNKCKGAQVWYAANEKSKCLAEILQKSFKENIDGNNNRLAKPAGDQYRILRDKHEGASVIMECGFLSNSEELALLKSEEYQAKLADSITKSIGEYYEVNKE